MKRINTGYVVDPSIQQPFTTKSLDFLQDGNKQMIEALCRNIISNRGLSYNVNVPYYIGNISSAPFPTDGCVFFNNELYVMAENHATLDYATIDTTPDTTADPLKFTDNIYRNVHNNRYLTYTNVSGGSLFAVADIVYVHIPPPAPTITIYTATTLNSWIASSTPKYFIDEKDFVHIEGIVHKTGSIGGSDYIFVLPVGYRPTTDKSFIVKCVDSGTKGDIVLTIFASTGQVLIDFTMLAGSTDTYVWLQGVSFYKNW